MRLIKIIFTSLIVIIFCLATLFYYKPSAIGLMAKSLIESLLSSNDVKFEFNNINIEKRESLYLIALDKVYLKSNGKTFIELNDIKILPKFDNFFQTLKIILDINVKNLVVTEINKQFNSDSFNLIYSGDLKRFTNIIDIKFKFKSHEIDNYLKDIDVKCMYKDGNAKKKITDCVFAINDSSSIIIKKASINGTKIKIDASIKDVPLSFYQIFENIFPQNKLIEFMKKKQISGDIVDGEFNVNFDISNLDKGKVDGNEMTGKFNIKNMFFHYNDRFPPLRDVNTNVTIDGDTVKFDIGSGYIESTKIDGSLVTIFWNEETQNRLIIDGYANGRAVDLLKFVNTKVLENLKRNLIDLNTANGNASTKIDIIIPFEKGIKNTYNISTKITDLSFNALKYLSLKGELTGKFDGSYVSLTGSGLLNNCPYKMTENFDVTTKDNLFNINVNISKKLNSYDLLQIRSGNSIVNLDYISKNDKSELYLSSDLSKIEFFTRYPTIYKSINESAKLDVVAVYKNDSIDLFNVTLTNKNDINVNGKIIIKNSDLYYDFPQIKSKNNNFKLLYKNNDQITDLQITGEEINLSKMSFDFLIPKNDKAKKSLKIRSYIKSAKMPNDVDIKELKIDFNCDKKNLCETAEIYGLLNEKDLNIGLSYLESKEIWKIHTDNAGSFLKAIDLFDKVEGGSLDIMFEKKLDNTDQKGTFILKNFLVIDPPSITRLISIVSLTGFLNSLGDHKKISFSQFTGQFKKGQKNLWEIFYTKGEGNYFDFVLNGEVDTQNRNVRIAGVVIPHYFIGSIIKPIPILKDLSLAIRTGLTKINPLDMTFTKEFKY